MAPTLEAPNARATARYQHVSAYKVRQVLSLIRGLTVDDAVRTLQLSEKEAAEDILKVLDSAVANAEHNFQLPPDELYVALAWADEGPTRKWGQPRARGRYFRVRKRTSHITIIVARYDEDEFARLMADAGIVRNRLKVRAATQNAQAFLRVRDEFGSFDTYLWNWVDGAPLRDPAGRIAETIPSSTPLSDSISKDLKKRGFTFVGTTIIYAFMQSVGLVDDHVMECFRFHGWSA